MEARQQRFMYDNRLSPMARIYLAEISKYYGTPIDCFDDDFYFSAIFKVSRRQITNWKQELKKYGYLKTVKFGDGRRCLEYCPDLQNQLIQGSQRKAIFLTSDRTLLRNTFEALNYYNSYIDSFTQFSDRIKGYCRIFCHTFANCLFDEQYYNMRMSVNGAVISQEFLQYVVEHFSLQVAWKTIQSVMRKYSQIEHLTLYVLASISKLYWEEYNIAKGLKNFEQHRKENDKIIQELLDFEEFKQKKHLSKQTGGENE